MSAMFPALHPNLPGKLGGGPGNKLYATEALHPNLPGKLGEGPGNKLHATEALHPNLPGKLGGGPAGCMLQLIMGEVTQTDIRLLYTNIE